MNDQWFRNNKWDRKEQKLFFEKLSKVRSNFHKAQYLRIKASFIFETKKKKLVLASIDLLNLLLEKFPVTSELAMCYYQLAESYAFLNEHEKAFIYFEKCLEQEKTFPNVKTPAALSYAEYIVKNNFHDQYNRALEVLNIALKNKFIFPNQFFLYHGLRAIILKDTAEQKRALSYAVKKQSGFSHHPLIGLVDSKHWLIKKLKK